MNRMPRYLTAIAVILGMLAVGGVALAAPKANHHNGKELLGDKVKTNGHHVLHQKGAHTVSVDVKNGKIAGVHTEKRLAHQPDRDHSRPYPPVNQQHRPQRRRGDKAHACVDTPKVVGQRVRR